MTAETGVLARRFAERSGEGRAALIPYLTAGYPGREESLEALEAVADQGADILELGIPFSDPLADGPTIQRATFQALERGMTVEGTLALLEDFRRRRDTPVVLFSYLNPVLRYGVGAFLADAGAAGAQGLLLTDLPAGADPELEEEVNEGGLDLIRLVAPTTGPDRVPVVARNARGFLYYISRTGVTGARSELRHALAQEVEGLRRAVELPVAVGFGISTPEQAALVAEVADGGVVGSALIQALDDRGVEGAARFAGALRRAMDRASGPGAAEA